MCLVSVSTLSANWLTASAFVEIEGDCLNRNIVLSFDLDFSGVEFLDISGYDNEVDATGC